MKRIITFCLLAGLLISSQTVKAQNFLWGHSGGGSAQTQGVDDETVKDMATDRNGNVYILSQVMKTGLNIDGQPITGYGANDVMLASFKPNGALRWVKMIGNGDVDDCFWLGTDDKDGVYFSARVNKTNATLNIDKDATSSQNYQTFVVVKYDTAGVFQWYRHPEADTLSSSYLVSYNRSIAMDVDGVGNVYWLMLLYPSAYGNGALKVTTYSPYIIKYSASGSFSYIKPDLDMNGLVIGSTAMTIDDVNSRFYLSGSRGSGTLVMGGTPITGDLFVGAFKLDGSLLWKKESTAGYGGFYNSRAAIDGAGNIYLTGNGYAATQSRPAMQFNGFTVTNGKGSGTPIIVKLDKNGNLLWGKDANVDAYTGAAAVSLLNNNEVIITGGYPRLLEWPGYNGKLNSPSNSGSNMFITRFNTQNGDVTGLDNVNSDAGYNEGATRIVSDGKGNVYIGGEFQQRMYVNLDTLKNTQGGQTDWFVIKYGPMWPASVENTAIASDVQVYPNPAMEQITVTGIAAGTNIQMLNMLGQQVLQTISRSDKEVLNTSGMIPGSYILQLTGSDGRKESYRLEKR